MLATEKSFAPWPPVTTLSMSTSQTLPQGVEDSSENHKLNPIFASSSEPSPTFSSDKQSFNSFVFDDVHCDATLESINLLAAKLLNFPESNKNDCEKCPEAEKEAILMPPVVTSSSNFSGGGVQINIPTTSSDSRAALDSFKLATKLLSLPESRQSNAHDADDKSGTRTCPEVEGEKEKGVTPTDVTSSPDSSQSDIQISIPTTSRDSRSTPDNLVRSEQSDDTDDNGQNARFKTEICRNFKERGHCLYGDLCQFAHGKDEMRNVSQHSKYKTKRCQKYWISGYCAYGPRCNFLHYEDISEVRPKPTQANSRIRENSGGSGNNEINADSGYSTPNPSMSPPGLGVKLPSTPLFLDILIRPTHGSGRLAALVKDGEWYWIDTITQKYV